MEQDLKNKIINFRRELHQHAEVSFKEFETHQRIKKILIQLGVSVQSIREINRQGQQPTGLIVDLQGKAEPQGQNFCVAFRADIDALQMEQLNHDLPYVSKNKGAAHMCGHDGHTACLVGFVPLFLKQINSVPKNKKVRLLFQPSEEGPLSGAQFMIKMGCLQGVNEVYGFHNWPVGNFGQIWCKEGPVMSSSLLVNIEIIGDGGHGSAPQNLKVAIWQAIHFYTQMQQFVKQMQEQKRTFVCTFPVFHSGQRFNVIDEKATLAGTIRVYDAQTRELFISKIKEILASTESKGFKVNLKISTFPLTSNTKKQAENVIRVARQFLGEDKVKEGTLPFRASEDFGYYTYQRPGAFFFFCTKKSQKDVFLHNARFNFKDELIQTASMFWLRLAKDRLKSN